MSEAIDISSTKHYLAQFDPDQPATPLEALLDGDCEHAADDFVLWLTDKQYEELYHLIVARLDDEDVRQLAATWASQA